jgi:methyltransferase FkbM-like protein
VGAQPGLALLHVPRTHDPSFSSLEGGRFDEAEPIEVEVSTVDREVEAAGLEPTVVKIDVEGRELDVVAGMERTLALRPAVLVEVSERSARALERRLGGYEGLCVGRRLEPLVRGRGIFNAIFLPR